MAALLCILTTFALAIVAVALGAPPIVILLALPVSISVAGMLFGRDVYEGCPQ